MYTTLLLIPWFKLHGWPLFGPLEIQPFGILVATGIMLGTRVAERRARATGVDPQLITDFLVHTIVIGGISAMVLNVAFYDQDRFEPMVRAVKSWFSDGPSEHFPYPGLSSYGGFLGGVGAAFWFRQKRQVSIMVMGDLFCYAFPFAWLFGRLGCFSVHDHPGLVSDFFLAVDNYNDEGLPRHDLGLYEVFWSLAAMALVHFLGKSPRPRGYFMALIPLFYAPIRFFLDYLREVPANGGDVRYLGFTPGQYGSLAMFVAGLLVAIRIARGPAPTVYIDGRGDGPPLTAADATSEKSEKSEKSETKASQRPGAKKKNKKK